MLNEEPENELPNFPSFIPFLPPLVGFLYEQLCFYFYFYEHWAKKNVVNGSVNHMVNSLVADFSKPKAVLCCLFFSYCGNHPFRGPPSTHCKLFIHELNYIN